jgi:transposase
MYMAFELAVKKWKLAFGSGGKKRVRTIDGRDLQQIVWEIAEAKRKLRLPDDAVVVSCYEAGGDGFWLHRWLVEQGVQNHVIDPGSIEHSGRKRRAKTDRLDVRMLQRKLIQYALGDHDVWSVVRVPSAEAEDGRRVHRERERLKKERVGHVNRVRQLLLGQGIVLERFRDVDKRLDDMTLPRHLKAELRRQLARLALVDQQLKDNQAEHARQLEQEASSPAIAKMKRLLTLKGVGDVGARMLVMELFGWRHFENRRQLGGCVGLTGTPHNSGNSEREQGISKAGRPQVRGLLVELSWLWLRHQPTSRLSLWFQERFGTGQRSRKVGIVALARKLLIALWRFVEHGKTPEGALLKAVS